MRVQSTTEVQSAELKVKDPCSVRLGVETVVETSFSSRSYEEHHELIDGALLMGVRLLVDPAQPHQARLTLHAVTGAEKRLAGQLRKLAEALEAFDAKQHGGWR